MRLRTQLRGVGPDCLNAHRTSGPRENSLFMGMEAGTPGSRLGRLGDPRRRRILRGDFLTAVCTAADGSGGLLGGSDSAGRRT